MGLSNVVDNTIEFNTEGETVIDLSGWDNVIGQFESLTAAVTGGASNDSADNAGNPENATAFQPVQGTNQATGAAATSFASGSALFKFSVLGRYLQLAGTANTVGRLLIYYYKIH